MPISIPSSTLENFTTFGDLLRFLRRRVGITQMELATEVGYSDTQISRLEQNLRLPDISAIEAHFVSALGLEDEPKAVARLLDLASKVRREDAPARGVCPYKGLNYFDEADADLFVGREALTATLVARVFSLTPNDPQHERRFLAIVGASGSGKSSLVRAGVVSALRWNKTSADWHIHVLTPTAHPLESLAVSLPNEGTSVRTSGILIEDLIRDPHSLHLFATRVLPSENRPPLLLIVDQFEELFALCRSEEERAAFIGNLLTASAEPNGPTVVVITLRADFYAHCASYPQLREALAKQQEYIGAMNGEELRRAIEEPAQRGRWEFEPGLVELLLHDVGHEPGALPLLSHALLETWQRRRGRTMTMSGYASSGGVRGAIAETAETVFSDQFTYEQQAIARRIFLRLTELGDETSFADTRRRAKFNELVLRPEEAETTHVVLKALADARLIITNEDSAEVAHEALIREWPTLRGWLEDNREGLRLQRHLTEAAQEWFTMNRESDVLYRGARLTYAREWAASHADEMNALEHEFLNASIEHSEREVAERETQRQRELNAAKKLAETEQRRADEQTLSAKNLRMRNRIITTIGLAAIALAVLALIFSQQSSNNAANAVQNAQAASYAQATAIANAEIAESAKAEAEMQSRIATARELAASANNNLNVDPERSILLALQGVNATASYNVVLSEVENALHRAIATSHIQQTFAGHEGSIWTIAYSPDGTRLATGGIDKMVQIWDANNHKNVLTINAHDADVDSVTFSLDGKRIATSSDDGTAKVWDATTGQLLLTLAGHTNWVTMVTFNPEGKQLATISFDKTIRFWDFATGKQIAIWSDLQDPGGHLTYDADGKHLIYVDAGQLHIRDVQSGEVISTINSDSGISLFALSPDGTRLAVIDEFIRVLDATNGYLLYNLTLPANRVEYMGFSPDSSRLAIAGRDEKVTILNVASGTELLTLAGHDQFIWRFAFSPDGNHLASADQGGTIKIWSLEPSQEVLTIPTDANGFLTLNPDGTRLAAIFMDSLRVFDIQSGKLLFENNLPQNDMAAIAFSPDGVELASGGTDQKIRLWNAVSGEMLHEITTTEAKTLAIAYHPDGKMVAVAGVDGIVSIYDHENERALLSWDAGVGEIFTISYSTDGSKLGVGTLDTNDAKIFDATTGKEILTLKGHTNNPISVAFSLDGTQIVTSGRDNTARIWDADTGKLQLTLSGHTSTATSARFSPNDTLIATSSRDGTIRVWDTITGTELLTFGIEGGAFNVEFTPDGEHLVTWDYAGIKIFTLEIDELVQIARSRLTRSLTAEECQKYLHVEQCPDLP